MENNNRGIKKIETKNGHKVEIYEFITGKEMRDIQDIYLADTKVSLVGEKANISEISGGVASKAQDKTFELLIVSVDGVKENVVESIGNLRLEDFDEVVLALNEITSVKKTESDTSTP